MRRTILAGVLLLLFAAAAWAVVQEQPQAAPAISWDNWRAAKAAAEKFDNEGKFAEAFKSYLEYVRQAEGLGNQELVAWGKNDAAYMLIKSHKLDPSVDLAPAKKLLEEGLAIEAATEDCKKCLATNMEYVNL
ncbi:MAG TPA: hypothetical protein VEG35_02415, partial [Burkholderiales bacterium]|nr:hypothetical protein [Burkholderiales bacterium]